MALHGSSRDRESLGGFFDGVLSEDTEVDDLRFLWLLSRESLESLVECQEFHVLSSLMELRERERDPSEASASFLCPSPLRVIDKDESHCSSRSGAHVSLVLPLRGSVARETKIHFVYESGRLEGVISSFSPE